MRYVVSREAFTKEDVIKIQCKKEYISLHAISNVENPMILFMFWHYAEIRKKPKKS